MIRLNSSQDMLEVRLPGGMIGIDAGWYPEGCVDGSYVIKTWGAVELETSVKDVDIASSIIVELVHRFTCEGMQSVSESTTTFEKLQIA